MTVNLLDRYLEKEQIMRTKLQLVGVTAMFIASKYEEIYAPECRDFVYISDKAYTRDEILRMEGQLLAKLNFQLTTPNAFVFVKRFAKVAGIATTPRSTTELLANYLVELTLQDYKMLKYLPSTICASAIYLALKTKGKTPWVRAAPRCRLTALESPVPRPSPPFVSAHGPSVSARGGRGRLRSSRSTRRTRRPTCRRACATSTSCTRTRRRTACRPCARSTRRRSTATSAASRPPTSAGNFASMA